MENSDRATERNREIITFFYLIFGHRIHEGMDPDEARKESYDAVSLRYGIGKGRLLNIISSNKDCRGLNGFAFRERARSLISEIELANDGLDFAKARNEKLISLLKECLDD